MHLHWALAVAMFLTAAASHGAPLEPVATIRMPGVKGRIGHLAVDIERHRFVAALGNDWWGFSAPPHVGTSKAWRVRRAARRVVSTGIEPAFRGERRCRPGRCP